VNPPSLLALFGFGPGGWGPAMLAAAAMTLAVSLAGYALGLVFGVGGAAVRLSRYRGLQWAGGAYTTLLRGIPDLLVIYLLYFGGSSLVGALARLFGADGFVGVPAFAAGAVAIGVVSGAYQTEVLRGAYLALSAGQGEAARSLGLSRWLTFRLVTAPQALRHALPGLANVWQLVLKDSALISLVGLVELIREAKIGAGATNQPFWFYLAAAALYLVVTGLSGGALQRLDAHLARPWEKAR